VVDYKTGRYPLTTDDARSSLPLAIYALAAARVMRRPCRRVELHHLPTGRVLAWEHSPEGLARQLDRAQDIAAECAAADEAYRGPAAGHGVAGHGVASHGVASQGVASQGDETFPARTGPRCGWCDFRGSCPEGSAATTARRPWDGLDTDAPLVADTDTAVADTAGADSQ
jgi:hypothetical protein